MASRRSAIVLCGKRAAAEPLEAPSWNGVALPGREGMAARLGVVAV